MAVVERADREVVPEFGVLLSRGRKVSQCARNLEGKNLRSHVRRGNRVRWRRR